MPVTDAFSTENAQRALWQWLTQNGATDPGATSPGSTRTKRLSVTPTISSSPAYTSGDELGTLQSITNASRLAGGGGQLLGVTVLDKTQAQRSALDIFFFNQSITVAGDNAAWLPSDGDMANCVGMIQIAAGNYNTAWAGTPTNSFAQVPLFSSAGSIGLNLPYTCLATTLFAMAVVRGTPTYTATTDLIFSYFFSPD